MSARDDYRVGDSVVCCVPGSWVDGKAGTVKRLNVQADVFGHLIQFAEGVSIVGYRELRHEC